MGYGPKTDIHRPKFLEKGRTHPSPFNYHIKREFDIINPQEINIVMQKDKNTKIKKEAAIYMKDGYTRGRSFENYSEPLKYPPHPPIGNYDIAEKIGGQKVKWSFFPKGRIFNDNYDKYLPAPNHYRVNEKFVKNLKHGGTSFGYGKKINIAKPLNDFPGVGEYTPKNTGIKV